MARIEIESKWGGLGEPSESRLVIKRKGALYFARGRQVPSTAVEALLDAVDHPPRDNSILTILGVTSVWLRENHAGALREHFRRDLYQTITSRQKSLFFRSFDDPLVVESALGKHSTGVALDDYPEVRLRIVRSGAEAKVLRSEGDRTFLYRWVEEDEGELHGHASAAISLALWRLLPRDFTNKSRLSEKALRYEIAEAVLQEIREEWDSVEAEDRIGAYLEPLRSRFKIEGSRIANLSSIDLSGSESWNATLRSPSLPGNVVITISLPLRENKPIGVDDFLRLIDRYTELTLAPTWFKEFLVAHPDAQLEIRFVEDRSLSRTALDRLTGDLRNNGQMGLAERVHQAADKVVFLELHLGAWSRWVVLPSREMILWEFQGDSVGNWSSGDFRFRDCYGWKCVGEVISEGGLREGAAP